MLLDKILFLLIHVYVGIFNPCIYLCVHLCFNVNLQMSTSLKMFSSMVIPSLLRMKQVSLYLEN